MLKLKIFFEAVVNWLAVNARYYGYLLPDSLEATLYLGLMLYFTFQLNQTWPPGTPA